MSSLGLSSLRIVFSSCPGSGGLAELGVGKLSVMILKEDICFDW